MDDAQDEPWLRYADRFDSEYWKDDEPVRLWLVDGSGVDDELHVPQTLWYRLSLIGAAYRLHLLPLFDGSTDPVFLSGEQCRGLIEEVDFVTVASDDGGLGSVAELIMALAGRAKRRADRALGIEFP